MNKFQKKVITTIATGSLLLSSALPAFASTTLIISGNGSDSTNTTNVTSQSSTQVVQSNATSVNNDIKVSSDTGSNSAKDNTGGEVSVNTGDSTVKVAVQNEVNSNVADVHDCTGCNSDTLVKVTGNGTDSENTVNLEQASGTQVFQTNVADVKNDVKVDSSTGSNSAEDNTGGDVAVTTGDSKVEVQAGTTANSNSARIMPTGDEAGGSVTLLITGNGEGSDNTIDLGLAHQVLLTQDNLTSIDNHVSVDSSTGDNEAEDNTGGIVGIETGDSTMKVTIDNAAGFNAADLGCGCMLSDIGAKIGENGTDTENLITAEIGAAQQLFQDNSCGLDGIHPKSLTDFGFPYHHSQPCFDNNLSLDGQTGDNHAKDNTGTPEGADPSIVTGDNESTVNVSNQGGSNVYGSFEMPEMNWPDFSGMNLSFSFDLSDLLSWLTTHA